MKTFFNLTLVLAAFVASCLVADETPTPQAPKRTITSTNTYHKKKGVSLLVFQMGGGFILDSKDHVRGAAMFAWTPTYHFNSSVSTRWSIGLTYRNVQKKDELKAGEFSVTLIEKPKYNSPLFGEVGGGFQYWTGDGSRKFYPEAKVGFGYQFGDGQGFFKSIQLSYTHVFHNPLKAPQLLGVLTIGF